MIKVFHILIFSCFILLYNAVGVTETKKSISNNLINKGISRSFSSERRIAVKSINDILSINIMIIELMLNNIKDKTVKENFEIELDTHKKNLKQEKKKVNEIINFTYNIQLIGYIDNISDQLDNMYNKIKQKLEENKLEENKLEENKLEENKLEENKLQENQIRNTRLELEDFEILVKIIQKIKDRFRDEKYRFCKKILSKDLQILRNEAMYCMLKNLINDLCKLNKLKVTIKVNSHIFIGISQESKENLRNFDDFNIKIFERNLKTQDKEYHIKDICNEISINETLVIKDQDGQDIEIIIKDLYQRLYNLINKLTRKKSQFISEIAYKIFPFFVVLNNSLKWPRVGKEDYEYFDLVNRFDNKIFASIPRVIIKCEEPGYGVISERKTYLQLNFC